MRTGTARPACAPRGKRFIAPFAAVLSMVAALSACEAHVGLPMALPRSAPFNQRLGMYTAYRPVEAQRTVIYDNRGGGTDHLDHVILANGMTVAHPLDLMPLVDRDSPTGRAAHHDTIVGQIGGVMLGAGAFSLVSGVEVGGGGFVVGQNSVGVVGLAAAAVGLVAGFTGFILGRVANGRRNVAFEQFDESLAMRLGVCNVGGIPVDCEHTPAAPIPFAPVPPMPPGAVPPTMPGSTPAGATAP